MITATDIETVVKKRGRSQEHLMFILRDLEHLSGNNQLDAPSLKMVAQIMNIPESSVAGFIDFYSMFSREPRGRYVVRVCKSGPCHVRGARRTLDMVEQVLGARVGQSTADGTFHLEETECLGACSVAPAMMVDESLYGDLTEKRLREIFDAYRSAAGPARVQAAETAGAVCMIADTGQTRWLTALVGAIDPDSLDSYRAAGGYRALEKAVKEYAPADVTGVVKSSNLRGRGGAGFPTGLKWSFVTKGPMQKHVICNADEGEPGTFKDRVLMEENPHLVIEGMAICGYAIDASIGYIYVRGEYRRSIERLQQAIEQARAAGLLGQKLFGSGFSFDVLIKEGGGSYVCGEESSLMNSMEGKRGYPRFRPPFPAGAGFMNQPSNVNNVETYASVPLIIDRGPEWYKSVGTSTCPGTKLYCLSGAVNRTGLIELPMGTTLRHIIDDYGKGIRSGKTFKFAQVGGSAGGILGPDMFDLPLDIDQPIKAGVTLGSGVVLVCDESTCPVDFLLNVLAFFEHESCGQCVPCRVGTAQIHYLAQKLARRQAVPADLDIMVQKAQLMKNSLCALGQSPIMPITSMLKLFRGDFLRHCEPNHACRECDMTIERYYQDST